MATYGELSKNLNDLCRYSEKYTMRLVSKSMVQDWNRLSNTEAENFEDLDKKTTRTKKPQVSKSYRYR